MPGRQLPWSQQPAQQAPPQGSEPAGQTQAPAVHCRPVGHVSQSWPCLPQAAASVPAKHVPVVASQQPAQQVPPHSLVPLGQRQVPLSHLLWPVQSASSQHAWHLPPQSLVPAGQRQTPASHRPPIGHAWHAWPPVPQAAASVPEGHVRVVASQQPAQQPPEAA